MLGPETTRTPLLATEFQERNPELSPDGRWIAYESNASGRFEIYVRPFPNVDDGSWPVSRDGGTRPLWARNGRELFYLDPGGRLMSVPVDFDSGFVGAPEVILEKAYGGGSVGRSYDVSPDGERFLRIQDQTGAVGASAPELILVLNWHDELERLVPTTR